MFEDGSGAEIGGDTPSDALCQRVDEAVVALAADDPALLGFAGQVARLRAVSRLIDRLEAQRVRLVATADRSGALADDGPATAAAWLRRHTTLTAAQAAERARIARRLSDLPIIADAFFAGDIGLAHATQIDRLCRDVGADQLTGVQRELITAATRLRDVAEFTRMCAGWRHALRPDLTAAADDRAHANRRLTFAATFDGAFHLSGLFDAQAGATLATAINAYMTHDPADSPPELRRSIDQRRADALFAIGNAALAALDAPTVAGARPHIVVRVDLADLINHPAHPDHHRLPGSGPVSPPTIDWAGPIGRETLMRLFDDCTITRIIVDGDGRPLDVGTTTRIWPAAIRKAITERDRRCRFDGCDRPPAWCDIDHIIPVEEHGPTQENNGILLCRHHHRAKRRDGWWPALHPDGTVTWTHADGRTRTDLPPSATDTHVRTLLDAGRAGTPCYTSPQRDRDAVTASEPPSTYQAGRGPPHAAHAPNRMRHWMPHPTGPYGRHAAIPARQRSTS
jgi:hypothetical protein